MALTMSRATAPRHNANAPPNHHLDFIHRFVRKERESATKPTPLSAEEHAVNRRQLSTVRFVKPKYADETQINVSGIFRKWTRCVIYEAFVAEDSELTTKNHSGIARKSASETGGPRSRIYVAKPRWTSFSSCAGITTSNRGALQRNTCVSSSSFIPR